MDVDIVHIFTNGNIMVFDVEGKQIPELQGFLFEVGEKLSIHCDKDTAFFFADWNKGEQRECNFSWWFEKKGDR